MVDIVSSTLSTVSVVSITSSVVDVLAASAVSEIGIIVMVCLIAILSTSEILSATKYWNKRLSAILNLAIAPLIVTFLAIVGYKVLTVLGN